MANVMNIVPAISQILSKRQKCQTIQRLYKDYTRLTLCKPMGNAISNVITFILPYLSTVMLWLAFKRITWPESCLYYLDFLFYMLLFQILCVHLYFHPHPLFPAALCSFSSSGTRSHRQLMSCSRYQGCM